MNLNWRHPSYLGRVVYAGVGLFVVGLVEVFVLPENAWGLGGMLAGILSVVGAFVLDRLRSRISQADSWGVTLWVSRRLWCPMNPDRFTDCWMRWSFGIGLTVAQTMVEPRPVAVRGGGSHGLR